MKKTYIAPATEIVNVQVESMLALSTIQGKSASSSAEVLTNEDKDWNIWDSEE